MSTRTAENPTFAGIREKYGFLPNVLIALKTITNYINHINGTEVDAPFLEEKG